MKRIIKLGLATVLIAPSLAMPVVLAQETTNTTTTTSTTDTKTLAQRVQERKTALKTKLTAGQKTRIVARCKASQTVVGNVQGKLQSAENARIKAYTTIQDNLNQLSTRLKEKGVNTTELNAALVDLKTKVDTYNTDLAAYKQTVSDLKEIDCKTDPEGFKASLETARTALKTVNTDATAIRTQIKDVIKPILQTIRTGLAGNNTTTTGGTN